MENNYKTLPGKQQVLITIDPAIHSLESVMMTANDFLNEWYIIIQSATEDRIQVKIIPKTSKDSTDESSLEEISLRFNNELIRNTFYIQQSKRTADLRKTLLETSLLANFVDSCNTGAQVVETTEACLDGRCNPVDSKGAGQALSTEQDYEDDPANILQVKNYEKSG